MVASIASGNTFKQAKAATYKDAYENPPEADVIPGDSYFTNAWYQRSFV